MASPFPNLLAPKGYAGREKVVASFREYFRAQGYETGSDLVRSRVKSLRDYNVSDEDIARLETVHGFGILVNTLPTAFWSIFHILSDSEVLSMVRKVVQQHVTTSSAEGTLLHIIDASKLREEPLLASIVNESLRYHANGGGARLVTEDIMLDGQYMLKKDSFLLMPNHEIHFHTEAWGESAGRFEATRFVNEHGDKKKSHTAFRGFGSGVNACPGRNFATTSILAMVAMLVSRFDILPIGGTWRNPGDDISNMSIVISEPKDKTAVRFRLRNGWEAGDWAFKAM